MPMANSTRKGTRNQSKRTKTLSKRVGRPTIADELLQNQAHGLLVLFDSMWGTLGWMLREATTREDVAAAFRAADVAPHHASAIEPFVRVTTTAATAARVREAKRLVNAARAKAVKLETQLRPLGDRVFQTLHALQRQLPAGDRAVALEHHRLRLDEYAPLRAEADEHDEEVKRLLIAQSDWEAAYCQDQLLSFVTRRKYEVNPRNLTHALAGLPSMGWERSFKRCSPLNTGVWPSRLYRLFELIVRSTHPSADSFRDSLQAQIQSLPSKKPEDVSFRDSLRENWRYLRIAIDRATALTNDASGRLPFRMFEIYIRLISEGRDQMEQLMRSIEELKDATPKARS